MDRTLLVMLDGLQMREWEETEEKEQGCKRDKFE
jgi:hypothetical protein